MAVIKISPPLRRRQFGRVNLIVELNPKEIINDASKDLATRVFSTGFILTKN